MKDLLTGLLVVFLVVVVLIGGYYVGIFLAVLSGIGLLVAIVIFAITFVSYTVWELVQNWKARRHRDS